ncbi:hypothetical protein XENOCAPTIV_012864 [Xenoophorus captivus]|uniref:Laminin N-terminal domain-containing protein n=1 Tax=Xenoophorus captivus TaxID=1517983 RepID=A0ABV0RYI0_9TELE
MCPIGTVLVSVYQILLDLLCDLSFKLQHTESAAVCPAGATWQPYQYYADDCLEAFGMSPKQVSDLAPTNLTRVICTEKYSRWVGAKVDRTVSAAGEASGPAAGDQDHTCPCPEALLTPV